MPKLPPKESAAGRPMRAIAGWDIGPIPGQRFVAVRLHVYSNPSVDPTQVELSDVFVLTPEQVSALSTALTENSALLLQLDNLPTSSH